MSAPINLIASYDRRLAAQRKSIRLAVSKGWAQEEIVRRQSELAQLEAEADATARLVLAGASLWRLSLEEATTAKSREAYRSAFEAIGGIDAERAAIARAGGGK